MPVLSFSRKFPSDLEVLMRLMMVTVDGAATHAVVVPGTDSEALHDFLVTHDPVADYFASFTDYVPKIDFDTNMEDFDRLRQHYATREAELEAMVSDLDTYYKARLADLNKDHTDAVNLIRTNRVRLVNLLTEVFRQVHKSIVAGWRRDSLSKIEVIKNIREMMPELTLSECKLMAEQLEF
jgi:ribosomal protein L7/L12